MVVGSTGDPVTPYTWAQSLSQQLANGVSNAFVSALWALDAVFQISQDDLTRVTGDHSNGMQNQHHGRDLNQNQ